MTLLWELGLARRIPRRAVDAFADAVDGHFLRRFPRSRTDIPAGKDYHRHVACHCALGTAAQVLHACGVDWDRRIPWLRPWFLRYQLPDGGLNCEEDAYGERGGRSSFLSTLPPLEAVLLCTDRPFTKREMAFLDRGATYLLERSLFRSKRTSSIIDRKWLRPTFPRFYFYDALRGLSFVAEWARRRERGVPEVSEALSRLRALVADGRLGSGRSEWRAARTLAWDGSAWVSRVRASTFPLLEEAARPAVARAVLLKFLRKAESSLREPR